MKRYGKLIIIVTLVILSFGIYYIQPIFAAETRPEFIIKAKKGDKTLIDNISVEGYYQASNFYGMGTETEITKDGTTYYPTQSYLSQLQGSVSDNEKMTQLQKDYRSFMRGKEPSLVNFFEDDSILAYVEITTDYLSAVTENSEFFIEVLDKKTNDVLSFSIEFPKAADYYSMYVEDVQVANNKLLVVTNGYSISSGNGPDEQHLYSIDLPNEKIEKDEKIQLDLIDPKDKEIQYVELLNAGNDLHSSEFLVYQVVLDVAQTEMYVENDIITLPVFGLIGVNIETGEQFLIDVSDEVGNQALGNTLPMENSTLYFYKTNDTTLSIYSYSLDQKELVEVESVELTAEQLATLKTDVVLQVKDGVVFFIESSNVKDRNMQIIAIDSNSGELVFEGAIEEKDDNLANKNELYLSEVLFQK
ncbi:MAG: hypothetical protein PWR19_1854 [Carnobacterium sp.]|uniref:hypothetical protein n=1 Tax=Carnobacterium sp. TaxID=48221 RepID=UPI002649425B|nr:hypothetical protein [Carnobacterium sp.]MDN5372808.1 hypothetical protein [Carnobacterium sp.]